MSISVPIYFVKQISLNKTAKVITKAALAKKALKKNIQVNMKVVFDDEGEVSHR